MKVDFKVKHSRKDSNLHVKLNTQFIWKKCYTSFFGNVHLVNSFVASLFKDTGCITETLSRKCNESFRSLAAAIF